MTDQGPMQPDYRRRMEAAEAEVERLRRQLGPCVCNTSPSTDGPDEFCPKHGRPHADLMNGWNAALVRAEAAEQRVKELEAEAKVDAEYYVTDTESFVAVHARMLAAEAREQALRDRMTEAISAEHSVEHLYEAEELRYTGVVLTDDLRKALSPPTAVTEESDR